MACYALFIATMAAIGVWQRYGPFYFVGLAVAGVLAVSHYWLDPRPHARGLLQGVPRQQLGRRRDLRRHRPRQPAVANAAALAPMILVILAHPYPRRSRACAALVEAIRDLPGLEVRSLYDLYPDFDVDRAAEQAALERARLVVWLHPLFWYTVPALMKHWLDEVLVRGFAYGPGGTALAGKGRAVGDDDRRRRCGLLSPAAHRPSVSRRSSRWSSRPRAIAA